MPPKKKIAKNRKVKPKSASTTNNNKNPTNNNKNVNIININTSTRRKKNTQSSKGKNTNNPNNPNNPDTSNQNIVNDTPFNRVMYIPPQQRTSKVVSIEDISNYGNNNRLLNNTGGGGGGGPGGNYIDSAKFDQFKKDLDQSVNNRFLLLENNYDNLNNTANRFMQLLPPPQSNIIDTSTLQPNPRVKNIGGRPKLTEEEKDKRAKLKNEKKNEKTAELTQKEYESVQNNFKKFSKKTKDYSKVAEDNILTPQENEKYSLRQPKVWWNEADINSQLDEIQKQQEQLLTTLDSKTYSTPMKNTTLLQQEYSPNMFEELINEDDNDKTNNDITELQNNIKNYENELLNLGISPIKNEIPFIAETKPPIIETKPPIVEIKPAKRGRKKKNI